MSKNMLIWTYVQPVIRTNFSIRFFVSRTKVNKKPIRQYIVIILPKLGKISIHCIVISTLQ